MRLLSAALSLALLTASSASAFEPRVFRMVPEEPQQGDIVQFIMDMPKGAEGGSVTIAGRTFPGFVVAGLLYVYAGIDMDTSAGTHTIVYDFGTEQGEREIVVRKRDFATERLQVESKYTDLDKETLERVDRENARLQKLWATTTPRRLWHEAFVKPADGPNGSPFGLRRYFNGQPRSPHSGLDIKAPDGSEVTAANDGTVVLAENLFFTGNTVIVDHGLGLYTIYAHLSRMDVAVGDQVHRSQPIGRVGATGRVTGPHLHWAVKLGGTRVDPAMLPGAAL